MQLRFQNSPENTQKHHFLTSEEALPVERLEEARELALSYWVSQGFESRRAADGRLVGIQSTLSLDPSGKGALELYEIVDGKIAADSGESESPERRTWREKWQKTADEIQRRLGFPLEPELFSNMLVSALLAGTEPPEMTENVKALLSSFRHSDAQGLYHFFASLRFAADMDCTGMAARARLAWGELDLHTASGIRELRLINDRILGSAAVGELSAVENVSHGKENGALRRHVFKVYLDDHEIQGAALDRGLKNNPVVSLNALFPVLVELSWGLRRFDERVQLKEHVGPESDPRSSEATVADVVAANLLYVVEHLRSGDWREGCRYYAAPDAFLLFFSELFVQFPEVERWFRIGEELKIAIAERRTSSAQGVTSAFAPLNLALRAIAAKNIGLDATPELRALIDLQDEEGGFSTFSPLYSFGSALGPKAYFGSNAQTTALALRAFSEQPPRELRGSVNLFSELAPSLLALGSR